MPKRLYLILVFGIALQCSIAYSQEVGIKFSKPIELPDIGKSELHYISAADFNGDKILDLVVGNHSGEVAVRVNSGTNKKPVYKTEKNLKAGDNDILIEHW